MEIKMGDYAKTLIDKPSYWGDVDFIVPKGSKGLVCEVFEDGAILLEMDSLKEIPFALVTFEKGEYEKTDA